MKSAEIDGWLCAGGITNNAYIFFVGMLMAQFTFTGYDACASETSLLRTDIERKQRKDSFCACPWQKFF